MALTDPASPRDNSSRSLSPCILRARGWFPTIGLEKPFGWFVSSVLAASVTGLMQRKD